MASLLDRALQRLWAAGLASGFGPAVRIGGGPSLEFDPDTPEGKAIYREVGKRITDIQETTRAAVRSYVARNRLAGGGVNELAKLIREDPSGAFSRSRARMIARTEAGTAYNRGSVLGYRQSGRVSKVRVFDGDGCGWGSHDDPRKADGMIVDLDEVDGNELAHPNCFVGSTVVFAPNATAGFARWFEGEVVVLRTAADKLLTCTTNHPILTGRGWVAAGDIRQGDHVFRCRNAQRVAALVDPNHRHRPACIEDVARALIEAGQGAPAPVPAAAVAFDHDTSRGDVGVIGADGLGVGDGQPGVGKHPSELSVVLADVRLAAFFAGRPLGQIVGGPGNAPHGGMGGGGLGLAPVWSEGGHAEAHGLRPAPQGIPAIAQALAKRGAGHIEDGGYVLDTLASLIAPDDVVHVSRELLEGHVFNLETDQRWYVANDIIAHNCRRAFAPVVELE